MEGNNAAVAVFPEFSKLLDSAISLSHPSPLTDPEHCDA